MAIRSLASLSIAFGLVSIPVKVYAATDAAAALHFKLLGRRGTRLKQQFVADDDLEEAARPPERLSPLPPAAPAESASSTQHAPARSARREEAPSANPRAVVQKAESDEPAAGAVVDRSTIVKGYEFESGRFVLFTPDELKALAEGSRPTIDIVSFIPERSIDPVYFDKPYFLAPDGRGSRPYTLLLRAMHETGRCALAKWAWRSREHVVQIRPGEGGLVLQQLRYADEVRSLADLGIELAEVSAAELELAIRLIEQISSEGYDPHQFVDEEKRRIQAAIERKIAGQEVVAPQRAEKAGAQIVDLMQALRASLATKPKGGARSSAEASALDAQTQSPRKPAKRAPRETTSRAPARGARSGR